MNRENLRSYLQYQKKQTEEIILDMIEAEFRREYSKLCIDNLAYKNKVARLKRKIAELEREPEMRSDICPGSSSCNNCKNVKDCPHGFQALVPQEESKDHYDRLVKFANNTWISEGHKEQASAVKWALENLRPEAIPKEPPKRTVMRIESAASRKWRNYHERDQRRGEKP